MHAFRNLIVGCSALSAAAAPAFAQTPADTGRNAVIIAEQKRGIKIHNVERLSDGGRTLVNLRFDRKPAWGNRESGSMGARRTAGLFIRYDYL
jgi:hypothetical protein